MKVKTRYPSGDNSATTQFPNSIMPYGFIKTKEQDQPDEELVADIIRLRDEGYSYRKINQELSTGMSETGLRGAYDRAKKKGLKS